MLTPLWYDEYMEFRYQDTCGLKKIDLDAAAAPIRAYAQSFDEPFALLPADEKLLRDIEAIAAKTVSASVRYILLIGIGGSNLGAKAVYDALYGSFDTLEPARFPKMLFADTMDPEYNDRLARFLKTIPREELLVIAVSKSGTTVESAENLKFAPAETPIVFITDRGSPWWEEASARNAERLEIPKEIGGRFSVFSSAGLFPLRAARIDIAAFRNGAAAITAANALFSAAALFLHSQQGKNIHNTFFFHPELESLGTWYRQLLAESIGKNGKGITPTVSLGTTDLHSVGQLYLGGPRDTITTFVNAPTNRAMTAIYEGVKKTYQNRGIPFMEILLPDLSPHSLGAFMQFKMMEVVLLAKLLNVNAFDQPDVDAYKTAARAAHLTTS